MKLIFFKILMLVIATFYIESSVASICCVPNQFEAHFFYDNGNVFIDVDTASSYINGTIQAAYDYDNKKSVLNISSVEISPLIPNPLTVNSVILNDFQKGVQYTFDGSKCSKDPLSPMTKQCIPDDAEQVSVGFIGANELQVITYTYSLPQNPGLFRAIVGKQACTPIVLEWFIGSSEAGSGTLNSLQVGDLTPGIKDPSIFTVPTYCLETVTEALQLDSNPCIPALGQFYLLCPVGKNHSLLTCQSRPVLYMNKSNMSAYRCFK